MGTLFQAFSAAKKKNHQKCFYFRQPGCGRQHRSIVGGFFLAAENDM
jgi:hypothetical protein